MGLTDTTAEVADVDAPRKKKFPAILLALVAAVLLGGGAFASVFMGFVSVPFLSDPPAADSPDAAMAQVDGAGGAEERHEIMTRKDGAMPEFVPLDELVISLGPNARARHLKIVLVAEVDPAQTDSVTILKPRLLDVLNTYLRAVDERDLDDPRAMTRLRAQMLRRARLVTPPDSVRDLLVQEFVLN